MKDTRPEITRFYLLKAIAFLAGVSLLLALVTWIASTAIPEPTTPQGILEITTTMPLVALILIAGGVWAHVILTAFGNWQRHRDLTRGQEETK